MVLFFREFWSLWCYAILEQVTRWHWLCSNLYIKSELLNNISNSNAALLFRKCGKLFKKILSYSKGGAASHVDLGAEGDVRPQLQYNNIINVLIFRWRNDWLVGLQLSFFFFFLIRIVEGQNNAECQSEENPRYIQIQEPRLRPEEILILA